MRPLTFITGVILGSSAALGCVLALLIFFRWVLTLDSTLDQTVVLSDLPLGDLLRYMGVFLGLAALACAGFLGELFRKPWRGAVDYLLAVAVTGVVIFFFAAAETRLRDLFVLAAVAGMGAIAFTVLARVGLLARVAGWFDD
jgi:hypothetical protein